MEQKAAVPAGPVETPDTVPPHVWRGLPEDLRLRQSAVNQSRVGVWASKPIPKGKKFGPFVGERKKRSQVTSNVYMWEVYFPAWGWMCVDATDPLRGNWLRYVNWARSGQEQNLFPLEINRAIYYKVLKPIAPGEELLVWYNGEDNPEIAAAIEEERASSLSRKNSPRAKRARKKLLERAKQGGAEGFKGQQRSCEPEHAVTEMRESEDGPKEEDEKPSFASVQPSQQTASPEEPADVEQVPVKEETLLACVPEVLVEEEVEDEGEEEEEEEEDLGKAPGDALPEDGGQASPRSEAVEAEEPPDAEASPQECEEEEQAEKLLPESPSGSPLSKLDPDPDGDPQESFLFPCLHCERRFTTKQGLERHMHIHISANCQTHTFKCRYCGKAFGSQINRRRHERRHEARPKKKPGSVSGTASSFSPSLPTESSSPDLVSSSGNFIIIGAQNGSDLQELPEAEKQSLAMETERSVVLDENGEPKEQHPCKYCKKVFGTHTNMRRHQRRIHERHLLPKGVRRKGMLPQEAPPQQPAAPPEESPNASPPPVYTPSGDPEDEGDPEEEYMVDISSNISENLSLYIDGKILSTSAVSTCEVIEVDPGSATLFGLDALIISPDKVTTALRVETASCAVKEVPNGGQATKRRTATPPLLPKIKTEVESELITPSSASSSSASSTSSVVGGLYPQATETLAFPKEKTVYLSPKLKQLLQTQDSHKPGLTLFTEAHRLGPPLTSVTALPAASGRFKRRTASPPNSPQHSPAMRETGKTEAGASFGLKVPKLESHCSSPAWSLSSRDERDTLSPQGVDAFKTSPVDWSAGRSGGSSCNQQPLDLSSGVNKRSEGSNKGAGEAVLDLSMHRKSSPEPEVKGGTAQSQVKKKKPNTSMLEKVLMNEYGGLEVAVEENPGVLGSASALSANDPSLAASPAAPSPVSEAPSPGSVVPTALHPSPPSLTPVTMNPPSPSTSTLASPTPPPPVLPTAPSPLPAPTSPPPLPPSSPTPSSLPVLSPKNSPSPVSSSPRNPSPSPLDPSLGFVDSLPVVVNPDSGPVDPDVNPPEHSAKSAGPAPPADVSVSQVEIVPSKADDSLMPSEELSLTSEDPSSTDCDSTVDLPNDPSSITETESSSPLLHLERPVGLEPSPVTVEQNPMDPSVGEAAVPEQNVEPGEQQLALSPLAPPPLDPPVLVASVPNPPLSASSPHPVPPESPPPLALPPSPFSFAIKEETPEEDRPLEASAVPAADVSSPPPPASAAGDLQTSSDQEEPQQETFCKNFVCNVCDEPFPSIKELSRHIVGHAEEWPFKCEFCVQLFRDAEALLEHRSTLHGVGRIYVCSTCAKEFAFLCNLKQHQKDLHPGQDCMHTEVENGKLRPQNYTDPARASLEPSPSTTATETSAEGSTLSLQDNPEALKAEELEEEEEDDLDDSTEELYTTIKIMASGGGKPKGPDVRLGINQHYPSFKPPPFPYHNRTPAGSVASATNFTTHNIPQTFSTAIRCTKCGKSFDNMPELHKHILACANASDKKRYTPKKNPIPLKQIVKPQNGVLSAVMGTNASGQNAFRRMGQPKRLNFSQEPSAKMKLNALNKKKNQLVQKAISQKNKIAASAKKASSLVPEEQEMHICPHCNREFTYLGSLNKHVAVSCPRKPPSKKVKKGSSGSLSSQDKNGNLRRRTADSEIKQQGSQAKLGKTRARTSGPAAPAAVPSKPQPGKVKAAPAQAQAQARPKRPAPFPAAPVTYAKKSKPALKGSPQQQQQPPAPQLPAPSPAPSTHPTPRLAMRMQRGGKELPPKKAPEAKLPLPPQPPPPPPPPPQQQQPKKEERFSVKTRERVGGPVTRSLQLVSSTAQAEGKTDDQSSLESREPQEHVLKLVK